MSSKVTLQYLFLYFALTALAICLALQFWWTDSLTLSFLKKESMALVGAAAIAWIAIIFLALYLVRKLVIKNDCERFIGPFKFLTEDNAKAVGVKTYIKAKNTLALISFPLFFITIAVFMGATSMYKKSELQRGIVQTVTVREIQFDPKRNPYAGYNYNHNGKMYQTFLAEKNLRVGDSVKIVFSKNNPNIVDYK